MLNIIKWSPRRDSNPHATLSRRLPYPLGYGGTFIIITKLLKICQLVDYISIKT